MEERRRMVIVQKSLSKLRRWDAEMVLDGTGLHSNGGRKRERPRCAAEMVVIRCQYSV